MALVVVSMFVFVITFIVGTLFLIMILSDLEHPGNYLLAIFPILSYASSIIMFKTWYDFDRKKEGIPLR